MARTASKPIRASSSAAAVLADSVDDAAFATTLAKGLVVLEAFKAGATQLGNMELSTLTGIPRPTVARLTHTLAELGYLRYDSNAPNIASARAHFAWRIRCSPTCSSARSRVP